MEKSIIEIDGSQMEGGGQILRNSIAFSCLVGQDVSIYNIRGNRSKPGLRPQHLHGIQLAGKICNAKIEGDHQDSMRILFRPSKICGGDYFADTKTAGSVCLIMQLSIPCLLFSDKLSTTVLKGGTNADMAPPIDFYTSVFKPNVSKFGIDFDVELVRRGFYPKGGGEVKVSVNPSYSLKAIEMTEFGEVSRIYGTAYIAGNLPMKVAYAMADSAKKYLKQFNKNVPVDIKVIKDEDRKAVGTGSGIIICAETTTGCIISGDCVGKRGKPSEEVGQTAAEMLQKSIDCKACFDVHMQDQLIVFMALACGTSRIRVGPLSLHTETAIHIAELITKAKFTIKKDEQSDSCVIECDGCEYKAG